LLDAARRAIGLGSGFTPSGDDFLTGLLAALRCFAPGQGSFQQVMLDIRRLIHRTTLPSFFMLKAALDGCYPEYLARVLESLSSGRPERVGSSLRLLLGTGATSGEDMLAGLIVYMKAASRIGYTHAAH
jgi:hypothetical protein